MLRLAVHLLNLTFRLSGSQEWGLPFYNTISLQLAKTTAEAYAAHAKKEEDLILELGGIIVGYCHLGLILCKSMLPPISPWQAVIINLPHFQWAYIAMSCFAPILESNISLEALTMAFERSGSRLKALTCNSGGWYLATYGGRTSINMHISRGCAPKLPSKYHLHDVNELDQI